ncbi:MAG: DUF1367 family protein [Thermodesulfobacteriota bacterium]|nr:DUF1367 family protein [Thermodesulfobacteriota bacterium]
MKARFLKSHTGLVPFDPESEEFLHRHKIGDVLEGNFVSMRNPDFHRKYFALLKTGFENWEPGEINSKYGTPEKNFDRFRRDVAILCGFYDVVIRLDGSTRVEAKSISFARMGKEEFEKLYSKTIDLFLAKIYNHSISEEELNRIVELYLSFT